jgi:hypothetical protein
MDDPIKIEELIKFPPVTNTVGTIGPIEKLIIGTLLYINKPGFILETGTLRGETTKFLYDFLQLNGIKDSLIATIDLPDVINNLKQNDPFFRLNNEIQLIAGRLPGVLKGLLSQSSRSVGFAVIDARHSFGAVSEELKIIHRSLAKGGYIYCHDFREFDDTFEGVVCAVRKFAKKYSYEIISLNPGPFIWGSAILKKPLKKRAVIRPMAIEFRAGLERFYRFVRGLE